MYIFEKSYLIEFLINQKNTYFIYVNIDRFFGVGISRPNS